MCFKGNATRWCYENGTWESKPNYQQCLDWPEMQSVIKYALCFRLADGAWQTTAQKTINMLRVFWRFRRREGTHLVANLNLARF